MVTKIHSGYYGLYKAPFTVTNNRKSSIYCLSKPDHEVLVLIPLTTSFFKDVADIVTRTTVREVYIVARDIGMPFISDYYLCWDYIYNTLNINCHILSNYPPEGTVRPDFAACIHVPRNGNGIPFGSLMSKFKIDPFVIKIYESTTSIQSQYACDVEVYDGTKRILLVAHMDNVEVGQIKKSKYEYDEIHVAYMNDNYGGWGQSMIMREYPELSSKLVANQFDSDETLAYARAHGVRIGEVIGRDIVQVKLF